MLAEGSIIAGTEQTADPSTLAQGAKEVARHQLQASSLGRSRFNPAPSCSDQHGLNTALCSNLGTAGKQLGGVLHDRIREKQLELIRLRRLRDVELMRVSDRQWTQHDRVDQRKDRAARTYAKRQRQNRDRSESRPPGQEAGSKAQIAQEVFEGSQRAHVATGLLHLIQVPHVASSPPPCVRRGLSARHGKILQLLEMKPQLLVELLVDGSAPQEGPKRHRHTMMQAWAHTDHTVSRRVVTADDKRRHWVASRSS
jgi:hypothetical protein